MITSIDMCLIKWFKQQTISSAIVQQLNCHIIQGGGIALRIRQEYPQMYDADVKFGRKGDRSKLGDFCVAEVYPDKLIYGYFGQYDLGMHKRQTNYEAVYSGLEKIKRNAIDNKIKLIGIPKNMASNLGGAHWPIIEKMIECIFDADCGIDVTICNYQPS